jgi:hypothetical protein
MPARDWDKLRRQDKARSNGSRPVDYSRTRRKKHRFKLHKGLPKFLQYKPAPKPPPAATRWLVINLGDSFATAVFVRKSGSPSWHCTGTDHPSISWFTGVLHMQVINDWISRHHYTFQWLSTNPVRTAYSQRTEHTPAEAYTPSQASPESSPNTGVSLNPNPSGVSLPDALPATGLAQTGVTTSLLLNPLTDSTPTAV